MYSNSMQLYFMYTDCENFTRQLTIMTNINQQHRWICSKRRREHNASRGYRFYYSELFILSIESRDIFEVT